MHSIFIMNGFGIWNASPRAGLVADLWQEVVLYFIIFFWVILTIAPVVWERGRRSLTGSAAIPTCTTVCPCVCLSVHPFNHFSATCLLPQLKNQTDITFITELCLLNLLTLAFWERVLLTCAVWTKPHLSLWLQRIENKPHFSYSFVEKPLLQAVVWTGQIRESHLLVNMVVNLKLNLFPNSSCAQGYCLWGLLAIV